MTKRDIYYTDTTLFRSQVVVDSIISTLCTSYRIPRDELGIISTSKGLAFGALVLKHRVTGGEINFSFQPINLTAQLDSLICQGPKIVLIIEKEAVFQTIYQIQSQLVGKIPPFLLVTGRGYPCISTTKFIHWLYKSLPDASFFALVDYDPYGLHIALKYRIGSKLIMDQPSTCCPSLCLLGILRLDLDLYSNQFQIDKSRTPLSKRSLGILKRLKGEAKSEGWDQVVRAAQDMESGGFGTEIESLYQQDTAKLVHYIVEKVNKHC